MIVYKYSIKPGTSALTLPSGAEILTVQVQRGEPQLWALVDPDAPPVSRGLIVVGTGQQFSVDKPLKYIATFQLEQGALVFHAFEVLS
jgi:hypothetical protein